MFFCLVCVRMCLFKWSLRMNFLLHSGHWNRFSPVWVRRCRCNSSDRVNRLPQNTHEHANGRSPENSKYVWVVDPSQGIKKYSSLPVCHLKWARRCDVFPYTLLQPGMWQICWRFRSACRSPSVQFGHVQATRFKRGFTTPSSVTFMVVVVVWVCGIVVTVVTVWFATGEAAAVGWGVGDVNVFAVTLLMIHFSCGSCLICCTVCGVSVIVCDTIGWACDVCWCCWTVCCVCCKYFEIEIYDFVPLSS